MAKEFTKNRLSPKRAAAGALTVPPALARLARVLGCQAAREFLTPDRPKSAEETAEASYRIPQTVLLQTNEGVIE
jgi:hypothetical protein